MKEKVHLVFASLFTDRAISYRHDRGLVLLGSGPGAVSAAGFVENPSIWDDIWINIYG